TYLLDLYETRIGLRGYIRPLNVGALFAHRYYPAIPRHVWLSSTLYRLLRVIVPDWFQRIVIPAPGWTTNGDTVLQLRRLRKIAEETKNHDLERDLYIEERKAERGIQLAHRLASLGRGLLLRGVNRSRFHFSMHVVFAPWL